MSVFRFGGSVPLKLVEGVPHQFGQNDRLPPDYNYSPYPGDLVLAGDALRAPPRWIPADGATGIAENTYPLLDDIFGVTGGFLIVPNVTPPAGLTYYIFTGRIE